MLHFKQKRNKSRQRFLDYIDFLVDEYFDKDMMHLFGIHSIESLSNSLAAFIQPKCLATELKAVRKDIGLLNRGQPTFDCQRSLSSHRNLVSSWDNKYRTYIERMAAVQEQMEVSRFMLYQYNKAKFEEFCGVTENLIIIENFLRMSKCIIESAAEMAVQSNAKPGKVSELVVDFLKKQVKPRQRKVLFPEEMVRTKHEKKREAKAAKKNQSHF